MVVASDIDFYFDAAIRCFNEARRLEPSLAAVGMQAMGQAYLERANQLYYRQYPGQSAEISLGDHHRSRVQATARVMIAAGELRHRAYVDL